MKWIKFIAASLFMLSFAAGCEKNEGPEGDGSTTTDLVLTTSTSEIFANGRDAVSFTVKYKGMTVSATVKDAVTGADVTNGFTTEEMGEHTFKAFYHEFESNIVTVTAIAVPDLLLEVNKDTIENTGTDQCTFTITKEGEDVTDKATLKCMTNGDVLRTPVWSSTISGDFEFRATYDSGDGNTMVSNILTVHVVFPDMSNPLELKVDKARIAANGSDVATFSVLYEGVDVTANAKIKNTQTGEYLSGNTFSYNGSEKFFTFAAEYEGATSFGVNVGFGDFAKKVLLIRFTGTWCGPCTLLGSYLKAVEEAMPGVIAQICVHSSDEYTVGDCTPYERAFYNQSVPRMYFDFSDTGMIGAYPASDIMARLNLCLSQNPPQAGIAVKSVIEGNDIKVEVRVTAQEAGEYYLAAVVLEDGLYGPQSGTNGYTHNDVLRGLITSSINGDSIGTLEENQEVVRNYTINKSVATTDNTRILVYVNAKRGITYYTTNATYCPVYGYVDYQFAE